MASSRSNWNVDQLPPPALTRGDGIRRLQTARRGRPFSRSPSTPLRRSFRLALAAGRSANAGPGCIETGSASRSRGKGRRTILKEKIAGETAKKEDTNNKSAAINNDPDSSDDEMVKKAIALSELAQVPSTSSSTAACLIEPLLFNPEAGKCQFCCVDLSIGEGIMIQECLHLFCKDCLQATIEGQKEAFTIPCPIGHPECTAHLNDAEVKQLVSPEVYQEYLDRSLCVARKKMKNVFVCKTESCVGWCEFDEGRKTFTCPLCHKINCVTCKAIHSGVTCDVYQDLVSTGQLSTLKELMDKENKSGWSQLVQSINGSAGESSAACGSVINGMIQKELLFNPLPFECSICFSDVAQGEGVILQECLHLFCQICLIAHIEHNNDALIKCPYIDENLSCPCYVQPCEIKALVPEAVLEKHLQRSVRLGESAIENSFHCKTKNCPGWCEYGEGAQRFDCPVCEKPNCIPCDAIHAGTCEEYKASFIQDKNEVLTTKALEAMIAMGQAMYCPKCKIPVQKLSGCDWLKCLACGTEICWVTKGPRWGPKGYRDTSGGCRCRIDGKTKCHPKCGNCH